MLPSESKRTIKETLRAIGKDKYYVKSKNNYFIIFHYPMSFMVHWVNQRICT